VEKEQKETTPGRGKRRGLGERTLLSTQVKNGEKMGKRKKRIHGENIRILWNGERTRGSTRNGKRKVGEKKEGEHSADPSLHTKRRKNRRVFRGKRGERTGGINF